MDENYQKAILVINEVKKAITGKDECIAKVFCAILAGGHILLEDVPGVGKTTLAVAFSKAMSLINHRVQFTPDVMPADVLGFEMYDKNTGEFTYHEGPIMCNFFLADEINRTSPKTQSALLEVMEEGSVTIDGKSHKVPSPFIVMATENPRGSAGTQLLPESQLDRFMICISMGYPSIKSEIAIAKEKSVGNGAAQVDAVINGYDLIGLYNVADQVYVHNNIYTYVAKLSAATRENPYIELGLSPRATIACVKMAKAWAFLHARDYVIPSDVVDVFMDVARHRILLTGRARIAKVSVHAILEDILSKTKQPSTFTERI